jgi:DNA-binding response OmpR family regulator
MLNLWHNNCLYISTYKDRDMCKRILVLDDDKAILNAISNILEYSGYEVDVLSKGDMIFEEIAQKKPDLILLDVMLADLDGREICQHIKSTHSTENIPVILISATHNLSDCLKQEGAPDDFLPKPFNMTQLLDKVEHQLHAA